MQVSGIKCVQLQKPLVLGMIGDALLPTSPAEGRAKERRLIREHFQEVSDGEAEPSGAASLGSQGDASSSEEEGAEVS